MDKKTQERYFDYILTYANTVLELSEILEKRCSKSRGGDIVIDRKSYMYFAKVGGVTLIDKKSTLELSFSFNKEKESVYFEKESLHNFIESDLNVSGLGRDFPTNKYVRSELFDTCLEHFIHAGKIEEKDKGYIVSKEEITYN